jgi:hypothetical protein
MSGKDNIKRQFKSLFDDITDPWNIRKKINWWLYNYNVLSSSF